MEYLIMILVLGLIIQSGRVEIWKRRAELLCDKSDHFEECYYRLLYKKDSRDE